MTDEKKQAEEEKDPTVLDEFMESQRNALKETRQALEGLIPQAFREHSSAAVKESIEGYRKLFNSMLDDVQSSLEKLKGGGEDDEKK